MSVPAGSVALVTGANTGIGYAVAEGLCARGFTVLVGSRDATRGERAVARLREAGHDPRLQLLDVTDPSSVDAVASSIDREVGRLDVLVNNAAVKLEFHPSPPSELPLDQVRAMFETNVFGSMRVIQAMVPLLLRSDTPRIVNLSSALGSLSLATTSGSVYRDRPMLGYNVSKTAVNALTVQFANQFRDTAMKVNAADPGYVRTAMTRHDGERSPEQGAAVVLELATLGPDGPTGGLFDERGPVAW